MCDYNIINVFQDIRTRSAIAWKREILIKVEAQLSAELRSV
jgi:hypothetical protein